MIRKTTEQFKQEILQVNPNIEILGEYLGAKEKTLCKCKICGNEWEASPTNLLGGKGCPKCGRKLGGEKRSNKSAKEFISKAIQIHGNKYNYSKVNYIRAIQPVEIICPIHGPFLQTPHSHLHGCGCPKCYTDNIVTNTEQFIKKAREIHGDKYDYSKVEYVNTKTKVCIICHKKDSNDIEHGEFWQTPNDHLQGQGCPKCSIENHGTRLRLSKRDFIEKANNIHNNKYDYSKINYINSKTKICIICHEKDENGIEHGEFWMKPENHIGGHQGCPICGRIKANKAESLTTEEFIQRAKTIHGNSFDYSKVNYINSSTKVEIICPKHGPFWQLPFSHLQGVECPKCNKSKGEKYIETLLKNNNIQYLNQYKFKDLPHIVVDFYIPSKNCVIEYNGIQHYIPVEHFGGQLKFEQQQIRDNNLRNYCKINKINLIEIPYQYDSIEKIKNYLDNYGK